MKENIREFIIHVKLIKQFFKQNLQLDLPTVDTGITAPIAASKLRFGNVSLYLVAITVIISTSVCDSFMSLAITDLA